MQNSDIVARLRVLNHHAKKLAENESLHDLYRDAFTRCENLTWEAADEIERLRAERKTMPPETSEQAQADTLARAMMLMIDRAAHTRKRVEVLESELKAMAVENERLRAKCHRYEIADIERRRFEEEG